MNIKDYTYDNAIYTQELYWDLYYRAWHDNDLNEKENKIFTILDMWYNYKLKECYPIIEDNKIIDTFELSCELLKSYRTPKQDKMLNKLIEWKNNENNKKIDLDL